MIFDIAGTSEQNEIKQHRWPAWTIDVLIGLGYLLTAFTFWLALQDRLPAAIASSSFAMVVLATAFIRTRLKLFLFAAFSFLLAVAMTVLENKALSGAILPIWLASTFLITHLSMLDVMASRRALYQLFAATFSGVAVDDNGKVMDLNEGAATIFGIERKDTVGLPLINLFHPASHVMVKRYLKEDGEAPMEALAVRKDGVRILVELRRKFHVHHNRRTLFLSVADVSSRKESEVLTHSSDRLTAIGSLAQTTGYEISNPLFLITGNLELCQSELNRAKQDPALPQPVSEALTNADELLKAVREGAERLGGVVKYLKALSVQDTRTMGPVDLNQVIEASLVAAAESVRNRSRVIKNFRDIPAIHGNAVLLEQVLVNLLTNAVEAMEGNSPEKCEIHLSTQTDSTNRVVVEIRDTGRGMDTEFRKRIFDPFFSTREASLGSGLGLCISRKAVLGMGGEITVDSVPGQGTTFRVFFPVVARKVTAGTMVSASVAPTVAATAIGKRKRILVIDDDVEIGKLIQRMLGENSDLEVITDSVKALKHVSQFATYDTILCDLHMPYFTGMDLYETARQSHPGIERRFVFMTGGAYTQRSRDFLKSVPNHCADKPLNFAQLEKLLVSAKG